MSISQLKVTPLKYFNYVLYDIFINYNHNRVSTIDDGETDNNFMTHVITTKDVTYGETITLRNGDIIFDLIVYQYVRSPDFPLTLIKLTDEQFLICKSIKYCLKYGRLRDGKRRYNDSLATYNLDLVLPNKLQAIYNYVYNKDRSIITNLDDYVDANKTVISTDVIFVTTEPSSRKNPIKSVNTIKYNDIPSFDSARHGSICMDIDRRCYGIVLNGKLVLSIDIINFIVNATF